MQQKHGGRVARARLPVEHLHVPHLFEPMMDLQIGRGYLCGRCGRGQAAGFRRAIRSHDASP